MEMGEIIKELRTKKGITQEELGKLIGVKKSAIRKYEAGIVENIPRSSIKIMADYFGVKPSYLMGWEENNSENFTNHEINVIKAYRNKPEMQNAVDKLLGVESSELANDMIDTIQKISIPTRKK